MRSYKARDSTGNKARSLAISVGIILLLFGVLGAVASLFGDERHIVNLPNRFVPMSVEINEESFDKVLFVGDTPDFSELKATVTYNDGKKATSKVKDSLAFEVSDVDTSLSGEKTLTVTFGNISDSVTVYVAEKDARIIADGGKAVGGGSGLFGHSVVIAAINRRVADTDNGNILQLMSGGHRLIVAALGNEDVA